VLPLKGAAAAATFGVETLPAPPVPPGSDQSISAHLVGSIDGIKRRAVFVLDNGQTWQSADDHEYDFDGNNIGVTITRNFAGNYWLRLDGAYFNVRVVRLK
jgi:hypothetical protein